MKGTNSNMLIKNLAPKLNEGQFVFISTKNPVDISISEILCQFKEKEGISIIMERGLADEKGLSYNYVAAWITLTVYSSLEAVGLTAKVSAALAKAGISCNAVAAFHHDHIFVPYRDADRVLSILRKLD